MSKVLIGMADENLISDLRSLLQEIPETQVVGVAPDTSKLVDYMNRFEPDLIFLHDALGPEPAAQVIRDLTSRRPGTAIVQVSPERSSTTVIRAMEAGARGVVAFPFAFEDFSAKVEAALEWAGQMNRVLAGAAAAMQTGRGNVIAVVGAKGGVGVSTVATHLAIDHHLRHPDQTVCVVDLDVEKGDISALLDVRQSVSVADLTKVHQDLSANTVADAVVMHETGIGLLLAPADVRESEFVTAESLRPVLALLRRDFDVVFVDAGGSVSPAQAAVIELADETLVVTTPDVLSVRAMRKRIVAWESLGVRREGELRVLINKVDKASIFPPAAVEQLTTADVLKNTLPLAQRLLEPAINERDPRVITEAAWWRTLASIREELGLEVQPRRSAEPAPAASAPQRAQRKRSFAARRVREAGSVALENVAIIPLAILMAFLAFQIAVYGLSAIWLGQSSSVAAREYGVHGNAAKAATKARATVPEPFSSGLGVQGHGQSVTVSMNVPLAVGGLVGMPSSLSQNVGVVREPS